MTPNETLKIELLSEEFHSLIRLDSTVSDEKEQHLLRIDDFFKKHPNGSTKSILEDWIDEMNNLGRGQGPSSFNFYPSEEGGGCHESCIGVATNPFGHNRDKNRNRTGFEGLMKDIIGQWFECDITRKTILITTDWSEEKFNNEWKQIIDSYTNKNKKVKIYYFLDYPVGTYIQMYPRP